MAFCFAKYESAVVPARVASSIVEFCFSPA
jgi:hypothetical protein